MTAISELHLINTQTRLKMLIFISRMTLFKSIVKIMGSTRKEIKYLMSSFKNIYSRSQKPKRKDIVFMKRFILLFDRFRLIS